MKKKCSIAIFSTGLALASSVGFASESDSLTSSITGSLGPTIEVSKISSGNRFQAVDIANGKTIYVSGTNSSVYKSDNSGESWQQVNSPGKHEKLQYRDILIDGNKVVLLSVGAADKSRVYTSLNQGKDWKLNLIGKQESDFYDCITNAKGKAWLYGDSKDGILTVFSDDQNASGWKKETLPFKATLNEGGFASSGTCINSNSDGDMIVGTGNTETPRLLLKKQNRDWQSITTPFKGGEAAGVFSVQLQDSNIYAFGGSLKDKESHAVGYRYNLTSNNWQQLPEVPLLGSIYGSALTNGSILVSNPQGVALLKKGEAKWQVISDLNIWALQCHTSFCVGVGADDTVIKITNI